MTSFNANQTVESAPLIPSPEFQVDKFPLFNASFPSNAREKRSVQKQLEKCNVVCRRMCLRICPHVRAGEKKRVNGKGNCELGSYALKNAADLWWAELAKHGFYSQDQVFTQADFDATIGHWSQMAWEKTREIGCGVAQCQEPERTIVVCNYYPPGNYFNQRVYNSGPPCTRTSGCVNNPASTCDTSSNLCFVGGVPSTMAPATVRPGTVRPGTVQPGTVRPGTVQPGTVRPGTVQPGTVRPGTVQPGTVRPGTVQPGTVRPGTVQPGTVRPDTVRPGTVQPGTVRPGTVRPGTVHPGTVRSGIVPA
ncbi:cysteine-rich secretory protein family domain-containing protein [Ditylenchus destructor]|nr:cysteine-rich secretory protein family domain-containing protein [Ditylenchus destructor]